MKFNVPDMSCGHCTSAIENAIKQADSAANVACDLAEHTVSVQSALPRETLATILQNAGYPSTPVAA
ncbi:MAG: copper chaperone [Halocynthiibacter sp.]|jgi:copper chaperone